VETRVSTEVDLLDSAEVGIFSELVYTSAELRGKKLHEIPKEILALHRNKET
jgi:hypothetical protein